MPCTFILSGAAVIAQNFLTKPYFARCKVAVAVSWTFRTSDLFMELAGHVPSLKLPVCQCAAHTEHVLQWGVIAPGMHMSADGHTMQRSRAFEEISNRDWMSDGCPASRAGTFCACAC